jgi:hypothetical protein
MGVLRTLLREPPFPEHNRAITCVALAFAVDGENDKADDTTNDKQKNGPTEIDMHAAANQDEDQSDGEKSQQAPEPTFDERWAFITHGSPTGCSGTVAENNLTAVLAVLARILMTFLDTGQHRHSGLALDEGAGERFQKLPNNPIWRVAVEHDQARPITDEVDRLHGPATRGTKLRFGFAFFLHGALFHR